MQEQNHVQMSQETIPPPPPRPREVRPSPMRKRSRSGEATQFDTLSISELVRGVVWHQKERATTITGKRHNHWTVTLQGFRWILSSLVQREHSWMSPRLKATNLMVICKDDGNLSATEVRAKTDEYGVETVLRFLSTYEGVETKTEPSIVEIARRVQARRDKKTTLTQTSVGGHQDIGTVDRANGTVQAQLRAYFLDVQERMKVRVIPGTQLFPWMCIQCGRWCATSPIRERKQTPHERTRGCRYESASGTIRRGCHGEDR